MTDEARAAAAARYGPMAPLAEIQREAFVAGAEWERGRWEPLREVCTAVSRLWEGYAEDTDSFDASIGHMQEALAALAEE